jgi:hypothetical protein
MEPAVAVSLSELLTRPRPTRTASAPVRPSDVGGRAAWDVLVRDGVLAALVDDAAAPADAPVTPATRAAALGARVPPRTVVAGATAAWVHCGGPPPRRLDLAYRSGTHRPELWEGATIWSASGLLADSVVLAGVRVTTLERTAVDVALRLPAERALPLVLHLVHTGADLEGAGRALERRTRAVGRPKARRVLAAARERLAAGA